MRKGRLVLLVLAVVVCTAWAAQASAITILNDGQQTIGGVQYQWAYQNTAPSSTSPLGTYTYYWRGIKGYFYWKSDGGVPYAGDGGNNGDHVVAAVSSVDPTGGWVQAGVQRNWEDVPRQYVEWNLADGTYVRHNTIASPDPGAQYVKVKWTGTKDPASGYWYYSAEVNSQLETFKLPNAVTAAAAQGECADLNANQGVIPATVYFGTNTTGYNGAAYQLNLLSHGDTWENWDTALSYQTTAVHDYINPPPGNSSKVIKYSAGNPYYYFGTWAP